MYISLSISRKETMECDSALFDGSENDDMYLEKVLAMTESLDPGLGYVLKSKVDLPVNVSINNAARRYLFSANPENDGQFRGFNVIGARGDIVIIQMITISNEVKIFITRQVDKKLITVATYDYFIDDEDAVFLEAFISPDLNKFLLRPNPFLCRKDLGIKCNFAVELFHINYPTGQCHNMKEILLGQSSKVTLTFDPKFNWRRVAVGSRVQSKPVHILDLHTNEVVAESQSRDPQYQILWQRTEHMVYSPDGRFLASLVSRCSSLREHVSNITVSGVVVYDSDSLEVLIVSSLNAKISPLLPGSGRRYHYKDGMVMCLLPQFSQNGNYIALPKVNTVVVDESDWEPETTESDEVHIYTVPFDPFDLQALCRTTIVRHLRSPSSAKALNLPDKLKKYLQFKPYLG